MNLPMLIGYDPRFYPSKTAHEREVLVLASSWSHGQPALLKPGHSRVMPRAFRCPGLLDYSMATCGGHNSDGKSSLWLWYM